MALYVTGFSVRVVIYQIKGSNALKTLTEPQTPMRPIRAWALISSDETKPGLSRHLLDPLCTPIKRAGHKGRLGVRSRLAPSSDPPPIRLGNAHRHTLTQATGSNRARALRRLSCQVRLIGVQRGSSRCLDSPGSVASDEMSAHARIGRTGIFRLLKHIYVE